MKKFDLVVIGSGPAGQKAAIQAAKANRSILVIEREKYVGGACVHHGTIPSKTLRESAVHLDSFTRRSGLEMTLGEDARLGVLLARLDRVVAAHEELIGWQLTRNGVEISYGRARFVSPHELEVRSPRGETERIEGRNFLIATGSRPRTPEGVPIDHEHIFDSDSIFSMTYLPASMTVLGSGVIACEYASIFACLGTKVMIVDRAPRPLSFLDPELTAHFVEAVGRRSGRYFGGRTIESVEWDGVSKVVTTLDDGSMLETEKMLCALGRVANLEGLEIENAGLVTTERGLLAVDANLRTSVPHIYAAGDVIGPPSLASASMEQGRRAACHALDIPLARMADLVPAGIFTIPEIGSIGLDEAAARKAHGRVLVGRARFAELARGQISAISDGLLKLVADESGKKILGVQIVGEGATELIHLGQVAMFANQPVEMFVDTIFNFPTLAEAYRVAALDIRRQQK